MFELFLIQGRTYEGVYLLRESITLPKVESIQFVFELLLVLIIKKSDERFLDMKKINLIITLLFLLLLGIVSGCEKKKVYVHCGDCDSCTDTSSPNDTASDTVEEIQDIIADTEDPQIAETVQDTVTDSADEPELFPDTSVEDTEEIEQEVESCGEVTFSYDAGSDVITSAFVSGSFNGWPRVVGAGGWDLTDPDSDSVWEYTTVLEPGHHLYKFLINEVWYIDESNPDREPDGYGGFNSVIDIVCD